MKTTLAYNQLAGRKIERIEAICDGVCAIALTLLVLDIKVPAGEAYHSEKDLLHALFTLGPKFLSYFLSFMTIGIFWTSLSVSNSLIGQSDRRPSWLALFALLFVSILPFTTAFLSEHFRFRTSIFLYWLNLFFFGLVMIIHWNYAYTHGYLKTDVHDKRAVYIALRNRGITAQSLYALGALICFVNNYLSIAFIIGVQLYFVLAIRFKPRRKTKL
jgi:TMEM175 potassium channel family protein